MVTELSAQSFPQCLQPGGLPCCRGPRVCRAMPSAPGGAGWPCCLGITGWHRASGSARGETCELPGLLRDVTALHTCAASWSPAEMSELLKALCGHLTTQPHFCSAFTTVSGNHGVTELRLICFSQVSWEKGFSPFM